jgi:hypothetical protein
MVNVNDFKRFVEFVSNKAQVGGTITPTLFNETAHRAQMLVYEKDYQTFLQTKELSRFLIKFITSKIYSNVKGSIAYPSNFQHVSSIDAYYVGENGGKVVGADEVKNESWGRVLSSALYKPTTRFPKFTLMGAKILIEPKSVHTVYLDYLKVPDAPVWGFTVVNNREVYDATTSTNFEFDQYSFNNVAAHYLTLIGMNLREGDLQGFANLYSQQTNSTL